MSKGRWLTVGLAALAALPLLYVVAYFALVTRDIDPFGSTYYDDIYRVGGDAAKTAFPPLNDLDRRIRHRYWTPPDDF